ncbi:MAG: hypothetical protein IT288_05140 [Bdellovibrionales bacterium]|nr:hypothetical protein [Bdellovibrionales bacterium]
MALSLSDLEKQKRKNRRSPAATDSVDQGVAPAPIQSAEPPRRPWDAPTAQSEPLRKAKSAGASAQNDTTEPLCLGMTQNLNTYFKSMIKLNRERMTRGKGPRFLLPFGYKQKKPSI